MISPLMLPMVLVGFVLVHFGAAPGEIAAQVALAFVFFGLVPLLYLVWLVHRARVQSLEVRDRARRTRPFLVGTASSAVGAALAAGVGTTAVPLVGALLGCIAVNAAVLMLVTRQWKISIHAAAIAGFASMLLFVAFAPWPHAVPPLFRPAEMAGVLLLIPLVMWARVRTGAHTAAQVWGGALFGLFTPFLELTLLWQIGIFEGA